MTIRMCLVLLSICLMPPSALALSLTPLSLALDPDDATGTITFVGTTTGVPSGGVVDDGAVSPSDITLIFSVDVVAGELANLILGTSGPTSVGVGHIGGPGVDVDGFLPSTGISPILDAIIASLGAVGTFVFDGALVPTSGGVGAGESSEEFFVSFASLPPSETIQVFSANEDVDTVFHGQFTVPEASTALLIGFGVLGLARRRRRV